LIATERAVSLKFGGPGEKLVDLSGVLKSFKATDSDFQRGNLGVRIEMSKVNQTPCVTV